MVKLLSQFYGVALMTHGELLTHQVLVKDIINQTPSDKRQDLLVRFFNKLKELQNKRASFSNTEMEKYLLESTI